MNMIEKEFASEVVNYNDLSRIMLYDNGGINIYLMKVLKLIFQVL